MAECGNVMNEILTSGEPCVGTWRLGSDSACGANDSKLANQYVTEQLEISGAPINVFKLLGVHEQGKLIDLTGNGNPIQGGTSGDTSVINAFTISADSWKSSQTGVNVVSAPAYIGYDFGTKKNSRGKERYAPGQPILNRVSSIRIQQSPILTRQASQIRIERSDGEIQPKNIQFSGAGDGKLVNVSAGIQNAEDKILLTAISSVQFQVVSMKHGVIGLASVDTPFYSNVVNFTITSGGTSFIANDMFMFDLSLTWIRVDIVNLPNNDALNIVPFKFSVPSRYWRFVPLIFSGTSTNEPWEIIRLELLDYEATTIDNIQDVFLLENRDRDYAQTSVNIKCQYQPFDAIGDMGKFGFNILDQYIFTCSFAQMVEKLGRPIITGDILEVCPEVAYDHNMNLVKKFVEVTDSGWSAEGYTAGWTPLIYRFVAQQLIPGQEHRDIINTVSKQKYGIDDSEFFSQISQVVTQDLTSSENIKKMAADAVPETGSDPSEISSGTSLYAVPREGSYDGRDIYVEDALPPDDAPYQEGYALPDMNTATDGEYFRLIYPPELKVPARLYQFSLFKRKWIYIETDRRGEYSSHKPSAQRILSSSTAKSPRSKL
jgi:hypothetical protein